MNIKKLYFLKPIIINVIYKKTLRSTKLKCSEIIDKYVKDISKKDKLKLKKEMIFIKKIYGLSFSEYFMYDIKNKKHKEIKDFITNKERIEYLRPLGTHKGYKILSDKYETYRNLSKYFKRDVMLVCDKTDYLDFKKYVEKHPTFVKKPTDASFGHGVSLVTVVDVKESFDEFVKNGPTIIEEQIIQNESLASFHPKSLNTIRMVTYLDDDNIVHIDHPFIKIGRGDSFVDNGGQGGILACIDAKTGVITTNGIDEMTNIYVKHPDTNITIKGFQIPYWEDAITFSKQLAKDFPYTRYIGWDIALSDTGWVLVEGNSRTQFFGQQMPCSKGMRKEFLKLTNQK